MTISSIYANNPEPANVFGDAAAPGSRGALSAGEAGADTLQEVTDRAKLSSLAPRIQAAFSEIAGSGNTVMQALVTNVEKLQDGFIDTLYTALSGESVDLSQKMTLRLNEDNALIVAGEHPDKEKVDAVLSEHPALSEAFGEIASQSELLRDIANINKVMTRQTGMEAYASSSGMERTPNTVYQMSLKGEMSHFYFSRP